MTSRSSQSAANAPRRYDPALVCAFRSTRAKFGGLSSMAAGFPLNVNGTPARTAEALYQACRFPHHPDVQDDILREKSPMSAKMVSRRNAERSRPDWDRVRVRIMRWCLAVKLAQHLDAFGRLLEQTVGRDIVEDSRKDPFWGAMPTTNGMLEGANVLGRLLMELRSRYESPTRYALLLVAPPTITRFRLLGSDVGVIDARPQFLEHLQSVWQTAVTPSLRLPPEDLTLPLDGVSNTRS